MSTAASTSAKKQKFDEALIKRCIEDSMDLIEKDNVKAAHEHLLAAI
jgi:hypothetical protein